VNGNTPSPERLLLLVSLALGLACRGGGRAEAAGQRAGETEAEPQAPTPRPPATSPPTVVFLGTSLTAGYGLEDPDQAYPALIQQKIDSAGLSYRVVNAGVSGETSAGAVRRIGWILRQAPAVLVIETGANDGLRGQNVDSLRANLQDIIDSTRLQSPKTRIVLAGMEALPNMGPAYAGPFRAVYPEVARANGIPLIPFLLDGVGGVDSLNQRDGIHPNVEGARVVADNVWQVLEPLLR
jgi:acyl-CoA thioesterase I